MVTVVLVLAALIVAGAAAFTVMRGEQDIEPVPEYVAEWHEGLDAGTVVAGNEGAAITAVLFADLECRPCGRLLRELDEIVAELPEAVRVVYVHFPSPRHRFALPAARAAECARDENKFVEWVRGVFANQDSLGLRSWGAFALGAGVRDTTRIAECAQGTETPLRVEAGRELGERFGVVGIPTVLVDGWRLGGQLNRERVGAMIRSRLREAGSQVP